MKGSTRKIQSPAHLYEILPDDERLIVDVLRVLITSHQIYRHTAKREFHLVFHIFMETKEYASFGLQQFHGAEKRKAFSWDFGMGINLSIKKLFDTWDKQANIL